MICTTVARKPLIGSVAANVVKHGVGGIAIDACRVGAAIASSLVKASPLSVGVSLAGSVDGSLRKEFFYDGSKGRWPANLVLCHLSGCTQDGTKQVPSRNGSGPGFRSAYVGGERKSPTNYFGGYATDGTVSVPSWSCQTGCSVAAIDSQSGVSVSSGGVKAARFRNMKNAPRPNELGGSGFDYGAAVGFGDTGTASRFFKQLRVGLSMEDTNSTEAQSLPQELVDYLILLISPPPEAGIGQATFWDAIPDVATLAAIPDQSMCGILVRGTPTVEQSAHLNRVLLPGGHLLLASPATEPTGHTGACRIEDAGFEIRDTILVPDQEGDGDKLHYVAKASRSEREAGCHMLPPKGAQDLVGRDPDSAGAQSPSAGSGRQIRTTYRCTHCDEDLGANPNTDDVCPISDGPHDPTVDDNSGVSNCHPTVKPVDLMVRLLADVSLTDAPVLDPFLGSGTTGIACVATGHNFIGIEREDEYVGIATARINHAKDTELKGDKWDACEVVSDYPWPPPAPTTKGKSKIEDLFGS